MKCIPVRSINKIPYAYVRGGTNKFCIQLYISACKRVVEDLIEPAVAIN